MTDTFLTAFDALPLGSFVGTSQGRRYVITRQDFSNGQSQKLIAEELSGNDYISLNLYRLATGARLKPCETSEAKVIEFVLNLVLL